MSWNPLRCGATPDLGREGFKKVEHATALTWRFLLVAEQHVRNLNAPHRCAEVSAGVAYQHACPSSPQLERGVPPDAVYTLLDETSWGATNRQFAHWGHPERRMERLPGLAARHRES